MAVAQIPNLPQMPDIQGGYARLGQQVANAGQQIGSAVTEYAKFFSSREGKKKLIAEIQSKYPAVTNAYPEDVLLRMDDKELGTRLAAVVGLENAVQSIKAVDPKFSTADIGQMYSEVFKQPDQARAIAKDWMAVAEKNRQEGIDKEALQTINSQTAPQMPQVSGAAPSTTPPPISEADLNRETADLLDPTKLTTPTQTSQSDLGQQLSAVDAERAQTQAPAMPVVAQRPKTREEFYSSIAGSGKIPSKSAQEIADKALRSEKDLAAEEFKALSLAQKKQLAGEAAVRKAREFAQRMNLGERNAKTNEMLVALTAINKVEDLTDAQTKIAADAMDAELSAKALRSSGGDENLAKMYDKIAEQNWMRSLNMDPNVTTAQGVASGIVEEVGRKFPAVKRGTAKQKETKPAAVAYDKEKKGTGQPLFNQLTPEQQAIVIKRYNANK